MLFSAITPEHYLKRIDEAQHRMREQELDCLIVFADAWRSANCRYLTGVKPYCMPMRRYFSYAPISVIILPVDSQPTLFIPLAHWARQDVAGTLRKQSFIDVQPLPKVQHALKDIGGTANRIGYEGKDITPWPVYELFHNAVAKEMKDTDILEVMRRVKSDIEIKLMEVASNINDQICEELVRDTIRFGVTEKDVAHQIEVLGYGMGCNDVDAQYMIGRHIDFGHPTDRTPVDGDILSLHVILGYEGYYSDNDRIMGFGNIRKEEEEVAHLAKEAFWTGLSKIKPGMTGLEAFEVANINENVKTHGHGIGLEGEEYLGGLHNWILEEGMAFTYSPVVSHDELDLEWGTEDVVVVTATGARTLTKFPIDYIIPATR